MILEALCQYYQRLESNPAKEAPAFGYAVTNVSSCLTLDEEGNVQGAISLVGEKKKPSKMIVPQQPKRPGQRPEAAFLCEKAEFLFGIYKEPKGAAYRFEASLAKHEEILAGVEDLGAQALLKFFAKRVAGSYAYPGLDMSALDVGGNIVFRLEGEDHFLHERPAIKAAWDKYSAGNESKAVLGQCLVTGAIGPIARIHGDLSGFGKDKPTLVGFNQKSFVSYRKKQGENAPVSEKAAFEYISALNNLVADPKHIIRLAGDKVVFWAEREAPQEENALWILFGGAPTEEDPTKEAENEGIEIDEPATRQIQSNLASLYSGKRPSEMGLSEMGLDKDLRFYILGMSASKTRLVVRFFNVNTFGTLIQRIMQHYADIEIQGPSWEAGLITPYRILRETAVARKNDNIPPLLESSLFRSILWGTPYAYSLYMAMISRIRAEAGQVNDRTNNRFNPINRTRIGMLKGYLNRAARMNQKEEMMDVALNLEEENRGYLLGRLFAVLEKAQTDALGKVNATIVDKYLNSALATPQTVFPVLLPLFEKHTSKSEKYYHKKTVSDILGQMPSEGFPQTLNAEDQGRFLIGYYHQRQAFYTAKTVKEEVEQNTLGDEREEQ